MSSASNGRPTGPCWAMFTSDMAESRQKTVTLQGLDANAFGEIMSYIYSGTLNVDKVQPLYQAADLLQLDYVRDTCSSYMDMSVQHSTCVDLYKFADFFSVDRVLKRSLHFICMHFAEVASSEKFCSLSVNQLTEIISHDELDIKEETTVWEAVVRWVQHSREDRLHHLPSILPHIRFNLLTSDDTAAILDHPLVREDPGRSAIRNVVKENSNMKGRAGMDTLEMAMVFMEETDSIGKDILYMNPRAGKYIRCRYSQEELPNITPLTAASGNNVYIVTEEPKGTDQLAVLEYNHAGNVWQQANISSLRRPDTLRKSEIEEFLVEVDKVLYYLLMENEVSSTSVLIRKYNRHTDQWQEGSKLELEAEVRASDPHVVSCGPHIYFLTKAEMHRYDLSQDRWCELTPPEVIPDICTAISMGTEIFCTDHAFSKTMVYDTESDYWQERPGWPNPDPENIDMNRPPFFLVLDDQLHVWFEAIQFLPFTKWEYLVYVYDRSTEVWRKLNDTVPRPCGDVFRPDSHLPVVRMYLPCLSAKGTDLSTSATFATSCP